MKNTTEIIKKIKSLRNPAACKGMERYGINTEKAYGVSIPVLRQMARQAGKDHELARELWKTGIHEAYLLAGFIDDPALVTKKQMEEWVRDFDSWDICDQCCNHLFRKTPFAHAKAVAWSKRTQTFVKRAGFVMMAVLAVHDKNTGDKVFEKYLKSINRAAPDERNYVKKAVNWALRQIGKRNRFLHKKALVVAERMAERPEKSARWIARDAVRELTGDTVKRILIKRKEYGR